MDPMEKEAAMASLDNAEIGVEHSFLWCKDQRSLLLYPEVTMDNKQQKGGKEQFPIEAQTWMITKVSKIFMNFKLFNSCYKGL